MLRKGRDDRCGLKVCVVDGEDVRLVGEGGWENMVENGDDLTRFFQKLRAKWMVKFNCHYLLSKETKDMGLA